MNNSKKRVSKVVAVAMASAMAMSSLSAALVVANAAERTAITMQNATGSATTVDLNQAAVADKNYDTEINLYYNADANGTAYNLPDAADFELTYTTPDGAEVTVPGSDIRWSRKSGSSASLKGNGNSATVSAQKGQAGDTVLTATVYSKIKPNDTKTNNEVAVSATIDFTVKVNRDIKTENDAILVVADDTISRYNGTTTVGWQVPTSVADNAAAYILDWGTPTDATKAGATIKPTSTSLVENNESTGSITLEANGDGTGNVVVAAQVDGKNVASVNVRVEASYTVLNRDEASGDIFGSSTVIGDKSINLSTNAGNKVIVPADTTLTVTGTVRDVVLKKGGTLIVDGGVVTNVDAGDGTIQVINGGKISSAISGDADVVVDGGTVGNVTTTGAITVQNGVIGTSGTSTTGALDADGAITITGGNVNGNVTSNSTITIDATGVDDNNDGIATKITGNVTSVGNYQAIKNADDQTEAGLVVSETPGKVMISQGENEGQTVTVTGTVKALNTGTVADGSGITVDAATYNNAVSLNTLTSDNITLNANGANVSVRSITPSAEKAWMTMRL